MATALNNLAALYDGFGDSRNAQADYEEALSIYRQFGDQRGQATTLNNIGGIYLKLGEQEKALDKYKEALALFAGLTGSSWRSCHVKQHRIGLFWAWGNTDSVGEVQ